MSRSIPTENRISTLPDPILHHILSFLPTKSAASTTILSKRWKPLWLSVPTLHFDDRPFKNFISFRHFVSSVFLLRDTNLPIRSFYLICSKQHSDEHDINRFIYAAVQRGGIENLDLNMFVNDLVVVDLPHLKTIHLYGVLLQRYEYLPKILLRCPNLEELDIKHVLLSTPQTLDLEENLPNLIRANTYNSTVLLTLCCRAEVLHVEVNLMHLRSNCQFPMYHNLIYMELILENNHSEKWKWLLEVLNHCPKLQNLTIHEDSGYEVVDNWIDPTIVPECLSTQLRTCLLKGYKNTKAPNDNEINFVQKGLNNM
ncbi:hypothetical protein TSUD_175740 [Trifolium subterraneum]|uniref:F-box domain-containing protein n=1 Tax=Trifolium subterraneum TaxID=3900 RepID=A0A2Z6M7T7_TRISU|nr:hypothetical protein TSUD_175740 [Trifolium subterraneum]